MAVAAQEAANPGTEQVPTTPLHPVLRLIHCLQRERGATCAMAGSRAKTNPTSHSDDISTVERDHHHHHHPYARNVRSARMATNSAVSSFYNRSFDRGGVEVASALYQIRQLVDNEDGNVGKHPGEINEECWSFHQVLTNYNSLLAAIIQNYVVDIILKRKKNIENMQIGAGHPNLNANKSTELSLLSLILSFVELKESLGNERATLSGLMAIGPNATGETVDGLLPEGDEKSNAPHLPIIVNDLVMVVENQHSILRGLEKQTGKKVQSWSVSHFNDESPLDENYCSLLRLVGESIKLSDAMQVLQEYIREDFDVNGFHKAMSMEDFWAGITLYMDRLHSMELLLLEELEQCECGFDSVDLLALDRNQLSCDPLHGVLGRTALAPQGMSQQEHAISIMDKMSHKELKESLISFVSQIPLDKSHATLGGAIINDATSNHQSENALVTPALTESDDDNQPKLEEWEISLYDVEFHKRIGRGAAGTTYLGKLHGQQVAVKVAAISEMGLDGWRTELSSLKMIHHTNIIRFFGAIYNPSPLTYCLVLEYCDGGDLSAVLMKDTPSNFFITVASDVVKGLCYLHKKNILHRDIKPSNVLLHGDVQSGNFVAKLTDFGLAAIVHNVSAHKQGGELTAETGTYRYMAPEVIRHERYQYSADVYSFAILMWEMVCREVPFKNMGQIEAAGRVALDQARPPFPPDIPSSVKTLIEKCWAEDPDVRMKVDCIIHALEELDCNLSMESKSWLQSPRGHPAYDTVVEEKTPKCEPVVNVEKDQKKKVSVLKMKSGLFNRRKSKAPDH